MGDHAWPFEAGTLASSRMQTDGPGRALMYTVIRDVPGLAPQGSITLTTWKKGRLFTAVEVVGVYRCQNPRLDAVEDDDSRILVELYDERTAKAVEAWIETEWDRFNPAEQ